MPALRLAEVQFALGVEEMPEQLIDEVIETLSRAEPLDREGGRDHAQFFGHLSASHRHFT